MANLNLSVVVLDYDGTIADNGVLNPEVRASIAEVRARGLTVMLATGRILSDLQRVLGDLRVVDAVVAENGAVLAGRIHELEQLHRIGRPLDAADALRQLVDERYAPVPRM
jgi:HAD superfamily hydrolase (TIGR01484 family)